MLKKLTEKRWIITISLAVVLAVMMIFWLIFADADKSDEFVLGGIAGFGAATVFPFIFVRISGFRFRLHEPDGWAHTYDIYGAKRNNAWLLLVFCSFGFLCCFLSYVFDFNGVNWMFISAFASATSGLLFDMNKNYW